ncbi:hypothetical protein [Paraliobacillus ryukyuensis]|uniref:hypothetical protein n=1 Tax=Paraliobacillus ryukyuensis TaxID=200904 RepID=UPI0009A733DB|nr:hypothetical protein [Paraliobacillus ryukyuensis]
MVGGWLSLGIGVLGVAIADDPAYLVGWKISTTRCYTQINDDEWRVDVQQYFYDDRGRYQGSKKYLYYTPPY